MSRSGAKTADRVPTTMEASPLRTRFHSSMRSARVSPLWKTATQEPNRPRNSATVCGVSEISGTITITPRPSARTRSITRMKTDVFPLPVTPYSSETPPLPERYCL